MRCLATVHALQRERGHTALALALKGTPQGKEFSKIYRVCTEKGRGGREGGREGVEKGNGIKKDEIR